MTNTNKKKKGFTLIELSIVLVIIGLIVGGVLVGQDLIKAAELRATISQIEKYNTAVNTFRLKYNGIPGDISNAATFFAAGTNEGGDGGADGDGLVEGVSADNTPCTASVCHSGESAGFWYHLSDAGMISESIPATDYTAITLSMNTAPQVKAGSGHVVVSAIGGRNYYGLVGAPTSGAVAAGGSTSTFTAAFTPAEAFQLDGKLDDGLPASGSMLSATIATPLPGTAAAAGDCNSATAYAVGSASADTLSCSLTIRSQF